MHSVLTCDELTHPPCCLLLDFDLADGLTIRVLQDAHFVRGGFDVVALKFSAEIFTQALRFFNGGAGTDREVVEFKRDLGFFGFD